MIIGIGLDVVDHSLTKLLDWDTDTDVQLRVFSAEELSIYNENKTIRFLAGRFAAKEAVLKCLGCGMQDGLSLKDVHILSDSFGKPVVELVGTVRQVSVDKLVASWHLSITHTESSSIAFVVAEG